MSRRNSVGALSALGPRLHRLSGAKAATEPIRRAAQGVYPPWPISTKGGVFFFSLRPRQYAKTRRGSERHKDRRHLALG